MSNQLSIASMPVRQFNQLYSLNDLHSASGLDKKHQPALFLRNAQTKELIAEINRSTNLHNAVVTKRGGDFQGTFACKEVVYAYAMWISPAFMLKVIRAYDDIYGGNKINTEQQHLIRKAVEDRVFRTGEHYQFVYKKLYNEFKIPSYKELPASQFDSAMSFLGGLNQIQDNMITVNKTNLICLVHHMKWLANFYREKRLYEVFKMLGSDFGVQTHDHFQDGYFVASNIANQFNE